MAWNQYEDLLDPQTLEDCDTAFEYPHCLIESIAALARAGFEISPAGGPEIGGLLFGTRTGNRVRILTQRPLACEHSSGPAFELSERDEAGLRKLLQDPPLADGTIPAVPVGWYLSEYWDLCLKKTSVEVHNRYFPEPWQLVIVVHRRKSQPLRIGFYLRDRNGKLKASAPVREITIDLDGSKEPEKQAQSPAAAEDPHRKPPTDDVSLATDPPCEQGASHPAFFPASGPLPGEPAEPRIGPIGDGQAPDRPASRAAAAVSPTREPEDLHQAISPEFASAAPLDRLEWEIVSDTPAAPGAHRQEHRPPAEESIREEDRGRGIAAAVCWNPAQSSAADTAATQSEDVLISILDGISQRRGMMLVTCMPGAEAGVLLELGDALNQQSIEFALLLDAPLDARQFFQMLAVDLTLKCSLSSQALQAAAFKDFLDAQESRGSTTVLIINNSQRLGLDVFHEIQRLNDLVSSPSRLLQIVLFATPEIHQRLRSPELLGFFRRINTVLCLP